MEADDELGERPGDHHGSGLGDDEPVHSGARGGWDKGVPAASDASERAASATLAASGEVSRSELYRSGGRALALSPDDAARTARNYLALRSIDARVAIEVDDDDVRLVVRGSADTLFFALVGISDVPVAVESNASPVSGGLPP